MQDFSILPVKIINELKHMGIFNINTLNDIGIVKAFLLLKKSGMTITNSILWRLDSISRQVPQSYINEVRKSELLMQVKNHYPVDLFPVVDVMQKFMADALYEARIALTQGEVPIGAVIVYKDEIIARGYNKTIFNNSIESHAEIIVIKQAENYLNSYRLNECDIYVTLEPCIMCAGAIINSRIRRLIFALSDNVSKVAGSVMNIFENSHLNKFTSVLSGIKKFESKKLLQYFFHQLR